MEIKFLNVDFVYNNKTPLRKKVLKKINMEIEPGKINSIIGKSGSGKTTIAELMNALIYPTNGRIEAGHYIIDKKQDIKHINNLRSNIGLVFQFPEEQFFNMTVKEELSFGMKYFNYKLMDIDKRCIDALVMVGLDESYLGRNPFSLSSGEMRKVAIASILAFNPKVIILDEPTIGLDSVSKKNLIYILRKLKNSYKKTIILISHDIDLVHAISDKVFLLHDGNIVLQGDKYTVFKEQKYIESLGMKIPKIIEFSNKVLDKKGIKMGYRDEINDLLKDIYRYAK